MITLVLAGTRHQFQDWCRENGVNPRHRSVVRYVRGRRDCLGLTGQRIEVVFYGTFWDREDAIEIAWWARHVQRTTLRPVVDLELPPYP